MKGCATTSSAVKLCCETYIDDMNAVFWSRTSQNYPMTDPCMYGMLMVSHLPWKLTWIRHGSRSSSENCLARGNEITWRSHSLSLANWTVGLASKPAQPWLGDGMAKSTKHVEPVLWICFWILDIYIRWYNMYIFIHTHIIHTYMHMSWCIYIYTYSHYMQHIYI